MAREWQTVLSELDITRGRLSDWGQRFNEGDRVRYIGPPEPGSGAPEFDSTDLMPGDEGWVIDLYEPARVCVVSWDAHGTVDMGSIEHLQWINERHEPDPMKRARGDPFR